MEIEEVEVPNSPEGQEGQKGKKKGGFTRSTSFSSSSSASPPHSPNKRSPLPNNRNSLSSPSHVEEVNGEGRSGEYYISSTPEQHPPVTSPTSNKSSSPLSGLSTPKMPNIKIKKQYSKIYRIKTKILQNLGKADKTTDEVFDEYETNFNKQQLNANRLHKEIANYLRCARGLHGASKALFEALAEVYEPEWVGHDLIYVQAQNADMLWTDFCHKIQDQTLGPLATYTQEFPEIRKKIDKRGRKLVDYDSQRHQLENLQRSTRRDEYKIARVKDQLENARSTYETLNKELYDELPNIFDQRIPGTSNSLHTLFAAEGTFMQEYSKISRELEAIAEKLSKEADKGTYNTKRGVAPKAPRPISVSGGSPQSPKSQNSPTVWYEVMDGDAPGKEREEEDEEEVVVDLEPSSHQDEETSYEKKDLTSGSSSSLRSGQQQDKEEADEDKEFEEVLNNKDDADHHPLPRPVSPTIPHTPPPDSPLPPLTTSETPSQIPRKMKDEKNRPTISGPVSPGKEETGRPYEEIEFEDKKVNGTPKVNGEVIGTPIPPGHKLKVEEIYDIPVGATTEGLPPGVLYRVKATYKYVREDVDELGFEVGELIQVVEYDDPEEQEEGWLCGIKESTNEKGLFPANFTRPI